MPNDQSPALDQDQIRERLDRYASRITQEIESMWEEDDVFNVTPLLIEALLINLNALIGTVPEDYQKQCVQRAIDVIQSAQGN